MLLIYYRWDDYLVISICILLSHFPITLRYFQLLYCQFVKMGEMTFRYKKEEQARRMNTKIQLISKRKPQANQAFSQKNAAQASELKFAMQFNQRKKPFNQSCSISLTSKETAQSRAYQTTFTNGRIHHGRLDGRSFLTNNTTKFSLMGRWVYVGSKGQHECEQAWCPCYYLAHIFSRRHRAPRDGFPTPCG